MWNPGLIEHILSVGDIVTRGPDWKWDDQDGGGRGKVIETRPDNEDGWVRVKWDKGGANNYRMGAKGAVDLKLV